MIKGKTEKGFKFEIDPEVANDMEFLERLGEATSDITKFPAIIKELLGEEQKRQLYDFVRNDEGRVPIEEAFNLFGEILSIANEERETKNS